jgi:hypothetical protein
MMTTSEVSNDAATFSDAALKARLVALREHLLAAPDPDDQPTRKQQEQAGIERSHRQNRFRAFADALTTIEKWGPKEAVIVSDLADVRRAEQHVVSTIDTLEVEWIPSNADEKMRNRLRYDIGALREAHEALRAVRFGIEWIGAMEMIPSLVLNFLATECGWRSRDGAFWRGSVSSLGDRLAELQARVGPARKAIAAEMARALEEVAV